MVLGDVSAASELDLCIDAISLQVVGEVFPAVGVFQGGVDIIGHLVSDPFIGAKSFCPCLGFAFAEGHTIFLLQFLAYADIPFQPIAVGDAFAVVVHAVEDEVAVGIGSVVVADYDILGIIDSHLFHILLCHLHHKIIGKLKIDNPWWTYEVMPKYYTDMTPRLYLDIFLPLIRLLIYDVLLYSWDHDVLAKP